MQDLDALDLLHGLDAGFDDLRCTMHDDLTQFEVEEFLAEQVLGFVDGLFTLNFDFKALLVGLGEIRGNAASMLAID